MSMLLLIFPYSLGVLKQIPWLLCVNCHQMSAYCLYSDGVFTGELNFYP